MNEVKLQNSKRVLGFVGENGNYGFDFENLEVSSHFIVTCVIVNESKLGELKNILSEIKEKYFQNDESEFLNVGNDHVKRKAILKDLSEADFRIFALVTDKKSVFEDSGLKHKRLFFKYLNGILYNEITNYYKKIELYTEETDTSEFMTEFRNYIVSNYMPDLLGEYDLAVLRSKEHILILLAEFIAETIAMGYEEGKKYEEYNEFYSILNNNLLPISLWPKKVEEYIRNLERYPSSECDKKIAYSSVKIAIKFIRENEKNKNIETKMQVKVVDYLLSNLLNNDANKYVYADEIINYLFETTAHEYTKHQFQTKIIAPLRDQGVLISSSPKGYKIPIKEKEILSYINQSSAEIKPMIHRIELCRDTVLQATGNQIDILKYKEFEYLTEIMNKDY